MTLSLYKTESATFKRQTTLLTVADHHGNGIQDGIFSCTQFFFSIFSSFSEGFFMRKLFGLIWCCSVYHNAGYDWDVGDRGVQELVHGDEMEEGQQVRSVQDRRGIEAGDRRQGWRAWRRLR